MSEGQEDLDEREKAIIEDVGRGLTYQEITKKHHVSPKTIKAIRDRGKKKPAPPDDGEIAAVIFDLFRKGKRPEQVVIERKLQPDRVMKLYEQFMEMKRRIVPSKNDLAELDEIYDTIDIDMKNRNLRTLKDRVRKLTEHFQRTQIPCSMCGKPVDLADESSIRFLRGISLRHTTGCPK